MAQCIYLMDLCARFNCCSSYTLDLNNDCIDINFGFNKKFTVKRFISNLLTLSELKTQTNCLYFIKEYRNLEPCIYI